MAWTATNGSMTLGPYDNGKFTFPINTGNTPVNWEVTYSDGKWRYHLYGKRKV